MSGRLLLVDDEPGLRQAVQAYLEDSGFVVEVASNAREGWDKVQQWLPDLVISDIMMPQVDGYQFLKQLREDPRFETLPVVFLTARGMTSDRIQGYNAGCDAYLPKPFDPEELVAIVSSLLERRGSCPNLNSPNFSDGQWRSDIVHNLHLSMGQHSPTARLACQKLCWAQGGNLRCRFGHAVGGREAELLLPRLGEQVVPGRRTAQQNGVKPSQPACARWRIKQPLELGRHEGEEKAFGGDRRKFSLLQRLERTQH